jgi:hypothetical protein
MGKMLVFSNAVEGREDEYNKWYDEVHVKDVVSVGPFKSAQRFKVSQGAGLPDQSHGYLAIYEFDGESKEAFESLRAARGGFQMSDAIAPNNALMIFVEDYEDS